MEIERGTLFLLTKHSTFYIFEIVIHVCKKISVANCGETPDRYTIDNAIELEERYGKAYEQR